MEKEGPARDFAAGSYRRVDDRPFGGNTRSPAALTIALPGHTAPLSRIRNTVVAVPPLAMEMVLIRRWVLRVAERA